MIRTSQNINCFGVIVYEDKTGFWKIILAFSVKKLLRISALHNIVCQNKCSQ